MKFSSKIAAILALLLFGAAFVHAQQQPEKTTSMTHVRVDILLTEYDADKKINSLPYTLYLVASDLEHHVNSPGTYLRMSIRVPVPTGSFPNSNSKSSPNTPVVNTQYQYEDVGTNIDVHAWKLDEGLYRLDCTVEHTAATSSQLGNGSEAQSNSYMVPVITRFNSQFQLKLHDGQSAEGMSATDPVSGHVMKINATLHALK